MRSCIKKKGGEWKKKYGREKKKPAGLANRGHLHESSCLHMLQLSSAPSSHPVGASRGRTLPYVDEGHNGVGGVEDSLTRTESLAVDDFPEGQNSRADY